MHTTRQGHRSRLSSRSEPLVFVLIALCTFASSSFSFEVEENMSKLIKKVAPMRPGPQETLSPFLFCVYHKDFYPAGNSKMEAPRMGDGMDFNPAAPYRMYHGERIPGFPQHPHRGMETITATLEGLIDHSDGMGNGGRYGGGDLQWMTAGGGLQHAEMFPLINTDKPNTTKFFQIWLNLLKKDKMCKPDFVMHWNEDITRVKSADGKGLVTVWAGEFDGNKGKTPTANSYAQDPAHDVCVWHIAIQAGGKVELPPSKIGSSSNRSLYFTEGSSLTVGGKQELTKQSVVVVDAGQKCELHNTGTNTAEVLVLQGKPIDEPVVQHGPFVMNTQNEIQQAFMDYQRTRFGGWPWPDESHVFPRDKGRFALIDGKEFRPPSK